MAASRRLDVQIGYGASHWATVLGVLTIYYDSTPIESIIDIIDAFIYIYTHIYIDKIVHIYIHIYIYILYSYKCCMYIICIYNV